eukprot:scaffold233555_cov31-Tisochrysis_lutea.AAC.2
MPASAPAGSGTSTSPSCHAGCAAVDAIADALRCIAGLVDGEHMLERGGRVGVGVRSLALGTEAYCWLEYNNAERDKRPPVHRAPDRAKPVVDGRHASALARMADLHRQRKRGRQWRPGAQPSGALLLELLVPRRTLVGCAFLIWLVEPVGEQNLKLIDGHDMLLACFHDLRTLAWRVLGRRCRPTLNAAPLGEPPRAPGLAAGVADLMSAAVPAGARPCDVPHGIDVVLVGGVVHPYDRKVWRRSACSAGAAQCEGGGRAHASAAQEARSLPSLKPQLGRKAEGTQPKHDW